MGEAAREVTGATTQNVIEDLEPYLVNELVPRIIEGILPYLNESVAPQIIEAVLPNIKESVAPEIVEGVLPYIMESVAPQIADSLVPHINAVIAPQIAAALVPQINDEIAPQIVDAVMPKIRNEVVPMILDDIVDDPRVRDLIREQSAGLVLDGVELVRRNLARGDDIVEGVALTALRKQARPIPENAVELVLAETRVEERPRISVQGMAERRRAWSSMEDPPPPPGRRYAFAGAVSRVAAFAFDTVVVGWVATQGLTTLKSIVTALVGELPQPLAILTTFLALSIVPIYMALGWWLTGRTVGMLLLGIRVWDHGTKPPKFLQSMLRAFLLYLAFPIWVFGSIFMATDRHRRTWLDHVTGTEVRYFVPDRRQIQAIMDAYYDERRIHSDKERLAEELEQFDAYSSTKTSSPSTDTE